MWGAPKGAPTISEPYLGSVNISYQSRIINPAGLLAAGGGCAGKAQRACLVSSIACCAAAARVRLHWLGSQLFFVVRIVVCSELFDSSGSCVRLKDGSAKPSPRNDVAVDVEPHCRRCGRTAVWSDDSLIHIARSLYKRGCRARARFPLRGIR